MSAEYFEYYTIILRGGRFFVDTLYNSSDSNTSKFQKWRVTVKHQEMSKQIRQQKQQLQH